MKTIKRTTRKETTSSESTIVNTFDNEEPWAPEPSRGRTGDRHALAPRHAKCLPGSDGDNAPASYEWTYLSRFEVKIGVGSNDNSARVLRNGRQQVRVDVYLTARDGNNNVVDLRKVHPDLRSRIDLVDERGYLLPVGWRVDWEPNSYQYNEVFLSSTRKGGINDGSTRDWIRHRALRDEHRARHRLVSQPALCEWPRCAEGACIWHNYRGGPVHTVA